MRGSWRGGDRHLPEHSLSDETMFIVVDTFDRFYWTMAVLAYHGDQPLTVLPANATMRAPVVLDRRSAGNGRSQSALRSRFVGGRCFRKSGGSSEEARARTVPTREASGMASRARSSGEGRSSSDTESRMSRIARRFMTSQNSDARAGMNQARDGRSGGEARVPRRWFRSCTSQPAHPDPLDSTVLRLARPTPARARARVLDRIPQSERAAERIANEDHRFTDELVERRAQRIEQRRWRETIGRRLAEAMGRQLGRDHATHVGPKVREQRSERCAVDPMPWTTTVVGRKPRPGASYACIRAEPVDTVRLANPRRCRANRTPRSMIGSKRGFMMIGSKRGFMMTLGSLRRCRLRAMRRRPELGCPDGQKMRPRKWSLG